MATPGSVGASHQIASIPVGKNPLLPVIDPSSGSVYLANYDWGDVLVIDAATDQVVANISMGGLPVPPAIDPTTAVTVGRSARVAGRDAYELVLTPRDPDSLVHQVRIALDAKQHVPLRFEVLADGGGRPAFEVAFTQVDFRTPDADQFRFNPPPGVSVSEATDERGPAGKQFPDTDRRPDGQNVRTVGTGWTTVLVARLDAAGPADGPKTGPRTDAKPGAQGGADVVAQALGGLPKVSGDWGSGRLLSGKLFSVLITDDGRVLAGLVTPERLYQAAKG